MKAYAVSKQAAMVFNAARAYEEAGKAGDAASLFRLYVTITDDLDGVADARARIKRLETKSELAQKLGAEPPEPKPAEPKPAEPKPAEPKSAGNNSLDSQAAGAKPAIPAVLAPTKLSPAPDRTLAWLTTGGAVALVGAGAVLAWIGAQKIHDANQLPVHSSGDIDTYNADFDRAQQFRTSGLSLLAVGVVAGGAATWLHLKSGTALSAGPDGQGGVWLAGRW